MIGMSSLTFRRHVEIKLPYSTSSKVQQLDQRYIYDQGEKNTPGYKQDAFKDFRSS